jgi:hypothetical protein
LAAVASSVALAVSPALIAPSASANTSEPGFDKVTASRHASIVADLDTGLPEKCFTILQSRADAKWLLIWVKTWSPGCGGTIHSDPPGEVYTRVNGRWTSVWVPTDRMPCWSVVTEHGASLDVYDDLLARFCGSSSIPKEYMRERLDTSECVGARPVVSQIKRGQRSGREGVADGAVAWTCSSAAADRTTHLLTAFEWDQAQSVYAQFSVVLPISRLESMRLIGSRIEIVGGDYSASDIPACCPDLKVTIDYRLREGALIEVRRTSRPA